MGVDCGVEASLGDTRSACIQGATLVYNQGCQVTSRLTIIAEEGDSMTPQGQRQSTLILTGCLLALVVFWVVVQSFQSLAGGIVVLVVCGVVGAIVATRERFAFTRMCPRCRAHVFEAAGSRSALS